jgi:hypothetical protein
MGEMKDSLLRGGRKGIILLEGSQASPVRPTDKSSVKVKMLSRLEAVASDTGRGIFVFPNKCRIA